MKSQLVEKKAPAIFMVLHFTKAATLSTEQFLKIVLFRLPLSRKDGKNGRGCGKNRSKSLPQFIAGDNCK